MKGFSFELLRHVVSKILSDISEVITAFIIRAILYVLSRHSLAQIYDE